MSIARRSEHNITDRVSVVTVLRVACSYHGRHSGWIDKEAVPNTQTHVIGVVLLALLLQAMVPIRTQDDAIDESFVGCQKRQ